MKKLNKENIKKSNTQTNVKVNKTQFPKTSAPALRALENAGFKYLEDLTQVTEKELLALHGMGPKAIRILKESLKQKNLTLKS